MGSTNLGNQSISYDFKEEILSVGFNKLNYKLHPKGIYSGGNLIRINDTSIEIEPMVALFEDDTNKLSVRIESQDNAILTVSNINIYIVARFTWINTENNFMDFLAVPAVDIEDTDLILGRLQFNGSVLTTDFDYSKKSWVSTHYYDFYNNRPSLFVTPTYPYSNNVYVYPSNGKFIHNGKVVDITTKTLSPSFSFPVSSYGRRDIVGINSNTGSIIIIQGASTSGAPLSTVPDNVLPLAIVTFPPSITSTVKGNYIQYIHPMYYKTSNLSDIEMSTRIGTVSGLENGLDGDTLDTHHASYYVDKLNEIASFLDVTLPL